MINHSKIQEELLKELDELKLENASLKAMYEQDIAGRKRAEEAIKESEERFSMLINSSADMVFLKDDQFRHIVVNIPLANFYGRKPDEIIGLTDFDLMSEDGAKQCRQSDCEALKTNSIIITEEACGDRYYETTKYPVKIRNKKIGVGGIIRDITGRKRADETIAMLAYSLRCINECVCITDINDKLIFVNQSFLNNYGYCEEELIGKHISIVRSSDTLPSSVEEILSATTRGGWQGRLWNKRKNGSEFPINLSTTIINDKEGKPLGLIGIATDITELIQAEATIKESQSLYYSFIEQIPNAVFRKDMEDRYVLVNSQFCRLKGLKKEDFLGKTPGEVAAREIVNQGEQGHATKYANLGEDIHKEIMQSGRIIEKEEEYSDINGDKKYMYVVRMPVFDSAKKIIGTQGIMFDITERKQSELIIQQQNNQLRELNATKDKFFSIIAHDLKSPFSGFLGLTQNMAEEAGNYTGQELARIGIHLHRSATNLFDLLKNLLEWAQMQNGSMSYQPEELSLSILIENNIALIKERSVQKGVAVINTVTDPQLVYADEKMINSVLLNLLSNAVKFTRRNGTVTVKARTSLNPMIEISISDTGMGVGREIIDKLFLIGEKTNRKGTEGELSSGLGLLLCKEFIEKHGGKIWVESEEGVGSTFYFTLPCS